MKWLLVLLLVACGPSNAEVKTAKTAHYATTAETLYEIAKQVAQQDYKIGETDTINMRFLTQPQMYSPDGGRQSAGADGYIQFDEGSIRLQLLVEVIPADGQQVVAVTPVAFQMLSGSPKPRELAPDDPNLPGWVHGRVDALSVAIYNAAKQHAVQ
jgi:hypothetical protein